MDFMDSKKPLAKSSGCGKGRKRCGATMFTSSDAVANNSFNW